MNFKKTLLDIKDVSFTLFKIMIPTLIIVKILEEIGFVLFLDSIFSPFTYLIGLPSNVAIVMITTILTSPYAGIIIFSGISFDESFTVAQASILASFMLFTHSLPIEGLISRKAGVRLRIIILLRIGGGIIFCLILCHLFQFTGWFSEIANINLPNLSSNENFYQWAISQIKGLIFIQIIIIVLLFFLEFLKVIGVEKIIHYFLSPFLKIIGIGKKATTIGVIGVTLGLGFGGGILIKEVKSGKIPTKDIFGILIFINLLHSVFEDTGVVLLLGPSLLIVLVGRTIFTFFLVFILMKLFAFLSKDLIEDYCLNKNIPEIFQNDFKK